jgi:hypothetical protein
MILNEYEVTMLLCRRDHILSSLYNMCLLNELYSKLILI